MNFHVSGHVNPGFRISRVAFWRFRSRLAGSRAAQTGDADQAPEQPFHILEFLLEHPGEIVTREQLRQVLWPADTFVDVDISVIAVINRLREVLGDSAESPRPMLR